MVRETVPSNHVLALVSNVSVAQRAVDELRAQGFEEPIIIENDQVGERLEEEAHPIANFFMKIWGRHVSEEPDYLDQYEQAARQGRTVIAVKASDQEEVDRIQSILERHQATNVRFFGTFAVTDLTPETNPAASADQPPPRKPTEERG
jgi:hypothetical protein